MVSFYFDLGSPYAYLTAMRIGNVLREPAEWRPILLGGLYRLTGLRDATDAAHERGVIGVPTIAIGDELFWGDDRLEDAAAHLRSLRAA
jgi:2-hydroxychromene-2-carboxylate isomerase